MAGTASELAARMQATALHSHRSPVVVPSAVATEADAPATPRRQTPARFTVELPREQHRFVKRFALDADSDASTVTRALLTLLETDPVLAERVRGIVQQ